MPPPLHTYSIIRNETDYETTCGPLLVHNVCLVRPALLYLNVHVLKVFYEQINYYYYYYYLQLTCRLRRLR